MPLLALRSAVGGVLMGLANLVPGISGGTMLLAAGIYPQFIDSIAEITTFKPRLRSIITVMCVAAAAGTAILLLAGGVKTLVVTRRWIMYSLFIGLTLGGVPVVWNSIGKISRGMIFGSVVGIAAMVLISFAQQSEFGATGGGSGRFLMLTIAGAAGASAMILPGVSGGYLLLVLGQYISILSGIDQFREYLSAGAIESAARVGVSVGLPVALGVILGVAGISNLLRFLLSKYRSITLGVLLGFLIGAVVGLWPFQRGVEPLPGDMVKGEIVTVASLAEIDEEDYPVEFFRPSPGEVGAAIALILLGFGVTVIIFRLGGRPSRPTGNT